MAHIDENINGKYCQLCKNNLAMVEALFNTTYICEQCMVKMSKTLNTYEIVKVEGFGNDRKNMQNNEL